MVCTDAIKQEVKHFANRKSAILASDMAPVVTGEDVDEELRVTIQNDFDPDVPENP